MCSEQRRVNDAKANTTFPTESQNSPDLSHHHATQHAVGGTVSDDVTGLKKCPRLLCYSASLRDSGQSGVTLQFHSPTPTCSLSYSNLQSLLIQPPVSPTPMSPNPTSSLPYSNVSYSNLQSPLLQCLLIQPPVSPTPTSSLPYSNVS
ncbi:uncharacterized [Tachysurus ichikawai]